MLRLRLKQGLDLNELESKFGEAPVKRITKKAPFLKKQGLIDYGNNIISLTEKGFLLSNAVISEFI